MVSKFYISIILIRKEITQNNCTSIIKCISPWCLKPCLLKTTTVFARYWLHTLIENSLGTSKHIHNSDLATSCVMMITEVALKNLALFPNTNLSRLSRIVTLNQIFIENLSTKVVKRSCHDNTQNLWVNLSWEKKCLFRNLTLRQKPTFYPEITKNLMFGNCEFCKKWDFENVNFVKIEISELWILWKMRY